MLQPAERLRGATAVRFDEPAATNRAGLGTGLLHALERRALGRVRLLLPMGVEPGAEARAIGVATPMIALPVAIETDAGPWRPRDPVVLAYAGNPRKKGLELLIGAWARAARPGWRLVVTGLDRDAGLRHIARHGIGEPPGVEWAGLVAPARYAELLRSAAVFVSASRHEDYGLAQLEALGAGLALVTVAATGPYPALGIARAAGPRLVASEASAEALGTALDAALAMDDDERARAAGTARELLRPHSREELRRRLAEQVLPMLAPRP
jgi:glycosyltransferase involved in cell wall biosynthesis